MKIEALETPIKFIIKALQPFRVRLFLQLGIAGSWAFFRVLEPYLFKNLLDAVAAWRPGEDVLPLVKSIGYFLVIGFAFALSFRLNNLTWLHVKPRLQHLLTTRMMHRMLRHAHAFYQKSFAGGLGGQLQEVAREVPNVLVTLINGFFSNSLSLLLAVVLLWHVQPIFAFFMAIWGLFFIGLAIIMGPSIQQRSSAAATAQVALTGQLVDVLINMVSVRFFAGKKREAVRLERISKTHVRAQQTREWLLFKVYFAQSVSFVIYETACCYFLVRGLREQVLTAGDFALVLNANMIMVFNLWQLAETISLFLVGVGKIKQGLHAVLAKHDVTDPEQPKPLVRPLRAIVFERVSFGHEPAAPLFEHLNLTIPIGQKIGIVGFSGSGKSTLVNLLLRVFDVTAGRITIGARDIREITQDELHRVIGVVPQDPCLFHRSLRENIRYAKPIATEEEIIAAAKQAYADNFITTVPGGYSALVGERGVKLSGGQRQRVAIAQMLLHNAPILIMDEATSQLDSITEHLIQKQLWEAVQEKTVLVIAHRLSTLLQMDRILVMDRGKIIQDGTHEALLKVRGRYKQLWSRQIGGWLPSKPDELAP